MMGKLGYDIKVEEMSDNELKFSQKAISDYKRLSDVIWKGDLFRLISPYDGNRAVLMYVDPAKRKAVLFSYTLNSRFGETFSRVLLQGLDPARSYRINEINIFSDGRRGMNFPGMSESGKVYTGDYLMKIGLNAGTAAPLSSAVYEITAE
jgi:alpha-galactosidase